MSYTIAYHERALADYEAIVSWYREKSERAAENFEKEVTDKINTLRVQPENFKKTYRRFHEAILKKYPYSILYLINEKESCVIISSIFHHSRNPKKKYKR